MRIGRFWRTDWFFGLMVALLLALAAQSDLIRSLENKAYDLGLRASRHEPSDRVVVIAIDEASIANLGRWPWPRDQHARLTDWLTAAQAKVIVNTVLFSEPQRDPGYDYVVRLQQQYERAFPAAVGQTPEAVPAGMAAPVAAGLRSEVAVMGHTLREAERALNTDRQLAESIARAGRVLLPMLLTLGEPLGNPDAPVPEFVGRNRIPQVTGNGEALPALALLAPIPALGAPSAALGHVNSTPDVDGGVRTESLVLRYYDSFYPSLALMAAARSLNLGPADVRVDLGREVRLGNLRIPVDRASQMRSYFYADRGGKPAFAQDSFFDVVSGKVPAAKFKDKIVLVGATAAGVGAPQVTPISPAMAPVVTLAHSVSSILQEDFFVVPAWSGWVEAVLLLLVALYLIVILPRLSAALGAVATGSLLVLLLGTHFALMAGAGLWLQMMGAATMLLLGHLLLTTKRFLVTERGKEQSDAQSAESNRMLALAFQGQGQLDMAWDKFRLVPLSDAVLDNLYNLALDFERKRQFNKAETVFRHMATFNPQFKDLQQRLTRAKQLSETVMLGGGGHPGGGMVVGDGTEKPMLGRYLIEKELGKGAMGVVYQGRDPKINRVVAIKTMALSQEFDAEELVEVKARFFREAETAGRLNHPHIVTIFDAGEEHDLAYIAMEFLKGHDLVPQTKPDGLLPLPRVVWVVARVAEALDYAHKNNVVHRDVKPANIMYEPTADQVKVTDFGIARITDSSRTRTGMVLGTPSYMSPEQLAGKKIDGRSDLYSLGVTLFQMCCGQLPFVGESMAQLMYKIANDATPDIRVLNPQVPPALAVIVEKAMRKDPATRYQTGAEMAGELKALLSRKAS